MIEQVINNNQIIAIIIRASYSKPGVSFFTPNNFSQQLAFMKHQKGKVIDAHIHNKVERTVVATQEILVIKKGKIRADLYDNDKKFIESKILSAGDIILLAAGGHGFEVLEDIEMIEVKQGPYAGDCDKTKFIAAKIDQVEVSNA